MEDVIAIARAHSQERISRQRAWYAARPNAAAPARFYSDLEKLELKENQFVIQLGWGGGWDSKTLGSRFDSQFMDRVIMHYKMARGRRKPGDPFPKSRRAAMNVRRAADGRVIETPGLPLGWALVEMVKAA